MFKQMLYTQWKWCGWMVAVGAVAGFALPLATVQRAGMLNPTIGDVIGMLTLMQSFRPLYPILALTMGLAVGITAWSHDHRGDHVYALTLPIPRWYYALLRFGAGAVLLIPVAICLWIGALVATTAATIPQGLDAKPTALALRFALAMLLGYSVVFAAAAGTSKTLRRVLTVVGALILVQIGLAAVGFELNVLVPAVIALFNWPGPLEIIFGTWMLIGV